MRLHALACCASIPALCRMLRVLDVINVNERHFIWNLEDPVSVSTLSQDLTGMARQGFSWWTSELASLVPKGLRGGAASAGPGLVVAVREGRLSLVSDESLTEQALLDTLARRARPNSRKTSAAPPTVRLRLPHAACLVRRIEVPERAQAEAGRILALDLERATPLNAADVYTAHTRDPAPATKGTIGIIQLIVKKSAVDLAVSRLEAAGVSVDGADCWAEDGVAVLPVNFLAGGTNGRSTRDLSSRRTAAGLAILATAMAMSAVWISIVRHQNALSGLEQQTAEARQRLAAIETQRGTNVSAVKDVQAVLALKSGRPTAVSILDELTRLLPDSAFLTEFSTDGDSVDISGFAKRAAGLVPLLERSAMFADAALSAPVTFDDARDKERFSYRLRLRQAAIVPSGEASPSMEPAP